MHSIWPVNATCHWGHPNYTIDDGSSPGSGVISNRPVATMSELSHERICHRCRFISFRQPSHSNGFDEMGGIGRVLEGFFRHPTGDGFKFRHSAARMAALLIRQPCMAACHECRNPIPSCRQMLECCQGIFVPMREHAGETQARPVPGRVEVADIQVAGDLPDVGGNAAVTERGRTGLHR